MSTQQKKPGSGISRVIKQGPHFICGLCGTRYTQNAAAEACLRNCVAKLNPSGVAATHTEHKSQTYRCTYCKRTYENFDEAKSCAKTCHGKIQKKIEQESQARTAQVSEEKLRVLAQLSGENLANLAPARKQAEQSNREATSARPDDTLARKKPVSTGTSSSSARDNNSISKGASAKSSPTPTPEIAKDSANRTKDLEDEDTVFLRENSHYRCLKCRKLYSSRREVYTCFESHSTVNQESFEISLDNTPPDISETVKAKAARDPKVAPEEPAEVASKDPNKLRSVAVKSEADKYFRDGARYGCRACKKKYFTKPEVITCFDSHGDEVMADISGPSTSSNESTTEPQPPPKVAGTESPAKSTGDKISNEQLVDAILESALREVRPASKEGPKDPEEKFYRNGAKYVCKKCGAKYFTKEDVITCYDRHS